MTKRNLTLQLDDDLIRKAKVIAAERDTSVSKLVAEQITELVERDSSYDRAHRRYLELLGSVHGSSDGQRFTRDELHDREALRENHG